MADLHSLVLGLGKEVWKLVDKGLEHKSTAQNLESTEKELGLILGEIEELVRKMNRPTREIENLQRELTKIQEALRKYSKIRWWNLWLAPYYQGKLKRAHSSIKDKISTELPLETNRNVMEILYRLQTMTTDQTNNIGQPTILKSGLEIFPEFTVGLDGPLMNKLKCDLLKDGGDQVLNLTGFAGTGKTTLAQQLCRDTLVRGWFNDNILFVSVGSEIQSIRYVAKQLQDKLRENGSKAVLLVLDDVRRGSEELVEQCRNQVSSNSKSKILLISRVALTGLGTRELMTPLSEDDAITLFRHFVQPSGTASYNIPDDIIFLQVVKGCAGFPLALKLIGSHLRGKPIEFWQKLLREWSQQGHSILHTNSELLTHLRNSLHVSEGYKSIKEFFRDLVLFPKHQMIPVTALIDIWVELYKQDEDGIDAMVFIHQLTAMNLADMVVRRRVGSDADNYYNYHFLTQHDILRELASKDSGNQEEIFKRKRLIIEINGNNRPEWWPQQPQRGINACVSLLKGSKQQRSAARILSISTDQKVTPDWCNIKAAEAEVLILNLQTQEYRLPKFIKKLRNLKVLILTYYGLSTSELEKFELLDSLSSLQRVRMEKVSVPFLCKLENLRKISFYKCGVIQAFKNSLIQISKAMPNLADLDIDHCNDMEKFPVGLCNISTLKKLSISNCRRFIALPEEIGRLQNLELLRVSYCRIFEEMPESMTRLQRLSFLDISDCPCLTQVPKEFANLSNLSKLYIWGTPIRKLPNSITNMEHLNFVICNKLTYDFWEAVRHVRPNLKVQGDYITVNSPSLASSSEFIDDL